MKLFSLYKAIKRALVPELKKFYSNELIIKRNDYQRKDIFVSPFFTIENTNLSCGVRLYGRGKVTKSKIGSYTYIHTDSTIAYAEIGKFCSIAQNTIIAQGEHPADFISTHPVFYSKNAPWNDKFSNEDIIEEHSSVIIGNDVWIGAGCYIKDGVKIGNGAIIASGSVVVKNVPDYAIVGGVPAKLIKYRFSEEIIKLLSDLKWWDYDIDILKKHKGFFQKKITEKELTSLIESLKK